MASASPGSRTRPTDARGVVVTEWLEVIYVRSHQAVLEPALPTLIAEAERSRSVAGVTAVRIYRHASLDGDLVVVLHHAPTACSPRPSVLGLRLADALRQLGPTDHAVWAQQSRAG